MLANEEDRIMLELADTVVRGDSVDFVMGADAEVQITDFDVMGDEELTLGMVDLLLDGPNRKAED